MTETVSKIKFSDVPEYKSEKMAELENELSIASFCFTDKHKEDLRLFVLNRELKIHEIHNKEIKDFIKLQDNA